MNDAWHDYDTDLSEAEKNYIYLALPLTLEVSEDSVTVEVFLEEVWARPLTTPDLVQFCEEFRLWVREGKPL